ncbi:MAG: NTP transferase domain-containing protein [Solobacterium sp.]|nr:NTP transferase domain-containing protein [Solobacterium sp.]MBR2727599.1 NTP transferase domain-containing protein [Solobacterium sp.]
MQKPTLVILAAGMGSRYGGMKQIDDVGNHGEPIIEFSIYDAHQAGFDKVVLIIKKEHEHLFREKLTDRVAKEMEVDFAYQDINDLPGAFTAPEGREKPWGTTQAMLACRGIVNEPFAIINADDFYGRDAYKVIYDYLVNNISDDHYAMVGYQCVKTLTDHGSVTRGVCRTKDGLLTKIKEVQNIIKKDGKAFIVDDDGSEEELDSDTLVSMNFWGFTPKVFDQAAPYFEKFLKENYEANPMKCEYVLPTTVGEMLEDGICDVKVLSSTDEWFGVTYREDKPYVQEKVAELKDKGVYPDILWK